MQGESTLLELRFFGAISVLVNGVEISHARTQKSLWLLAYLALQQGRLVHRETLAARLWPDSDSDKARNNLRYTLRDLRHVLAGGNPALVSTWLALSLDRQKCWSDVGAFDEAIRLSANPDLLRSAVELYQGPFLEACSEPWAEMAREERLTQYLQAVERLAASAPAAEAVPVLQRAIAHYPFRESLVRSLMATLMRQGSLAEAAQVFHDFRARLPLRQTPSPDTMAIHHEILRQRSVAPRSPAPTPVVGRAPSQPMHPPGGPLRPDATLYVERPADAELMDAIDRGESILRLKGSRQSGKSSLLARAIERARQNGARVLHTDVSTFAGSHLASLDAFVGGLLQTADAPSPFPPLIRLERWLSRELDATPGRFVWAIDGVDRLFQLPFHDEFFSKIRAWHNKGAIDYEGPFSRLTVALAYSTEAKRFIADEDRSPFNVGVLCELADFGPGELASLNQRLGKPLRSAAESERFRRLVGGHPYLSHLGLHALATGHADLALLETSTIDWEYNPFRANLRPLKRDVDTSPALADAVRRLLLGDAALSDDQLFLLAIAGIVAGDTAATVRLRCGLYEPFLRRMLGL